MQYTETQLSKLIQDVELEFTAYLAKAEEVGNTLAKSEDGEKPEKKPEDGEKKPPFEAKPEGEQKPEGEEKPAEEGKPEGEAHPEQHSQGEGHDYDEEDMQHMHKMYMSMSKGELKAHHDAIMKCVSGGGMMGKSEEGGGIGNTKSENPPQPKVKGENLDSDPKNGGIDAGAPHNALGPKSPASDANGAKINKSEAARRNGGKIEEQAPHNSPGAKSPASKADGVQMQKSENTEVELLKSELGSANTKYEELKKNFDGVAAFLTKLLEKKAAPAGKAITSMDVIAKSEGAGEDSEKTLTKADIHTILCKKASEPSLQKSDRDAINVYYEQGQVNVTGISHLLK
jgi:hypothetical protein